MVWLGVWGVIIIKIYTLNSKKKLNNNFDNNMCYFFLQ